MQLKGRSGRSQPKSVLIQPVPLLGRPAEFLGGVGRFELHAEASPKVIRVGQELEFRIKVTGPAAWGMADRPDLARYGRLGLGLRIEPRPDETINEPPARTFVYRLRPTHAGEAVLPPVAIAAFDPSLSRYVTHVTTGCADPRCRGRILRPHDGHYDPPSTAMSRPALISVIVVALATLSSAVYLILSLVRRRLARPHAVRSGIGSAIRETDGPILWGRFGRRILAWPPRADRLSTGRPGFRFRHPKCLDLEVANSANESPEMLGDAPSEFMNV